MARKQANLPKISVIIPSFNKIAYIQTTLQSVVEQKYPNLEVIIQDGVSTDGTLEVIKKYAKKYPNIFKWESKKDKGQVDAINKGMKKATGDIVAYLNADDVYKKNALWEVGKYFQDHPDTLWLIGYCDIIDDYGKVISSWVTKYKNFLIDLNLYTALLVVNYIGQPATFLSKKAYQKYGPFIGTEKYVMEYDLWIKLGRVQMPKVIKKNLASFRLTMNNISATSFKELLSLDFQIAKSYNNNLIILFFHLLHNWARIGLITLLKKYE